mmetsp:Transcript_6734/g.19468  ORF Transcript_6734/g.19468 Transcript_6734/m.19468 type:complete len:258 (+) Transcript_6734:2760-3533(+)
MQSFLRLLLDGVGKEKRKFFQQIGMILEQVGDLFQHFLDSTLLLLVRVKNFQKLTIGSFIICKATLDLSHVGNSVVKFHSLVLHRWLWRLLLKHLLLLLLLLLLVPPPRQWRPKPSRPDRATKSPLSMVLPSTTEGVSSEAWMPAHWTSRAFPTRSSTTSSRPARLPLSNSSHPMATWRTSRSRRTRKRKYESEKDTRSNSTMDTVLPCFAFEASRTPGFRTSSPSRGWKNTQQQQQQTNGPLSNARTTCNKNYSIL